MALLLAIIVFCQVLLYRETRGREKEIANQPVSVEVKHTKSKEKEALKTTTVLFFYRVDRALNHCGERFKKDTVSVTGFTGFVWTKGRFE